MGVGSGLHQWRRSAGGTKAVRYVVVSGATVALGQLTLVLAFGVLGWTARASNFLAFFVSSVPSYYFHRSWTWGKSGHTHLLREVVPFCVLALVGLTLSTWAVGFVDSRARAAVTSRALRTALVMAASLTAFGLVWIAKFVILNRFLFGSAET